MLGEGVRAVPALGRGTRGHDGVLCPYWSMDTDAVDVTVVIGCAVPTMRLLRGSGSG